MKDPRIDQAKKQQDMERVIRGLAESWPSKLVARKKIEAFTGGTHNRRTMANMDHLGKGPKGAFKVGRSVVYPVDSLCDWLISRSSPDLRKNPVVA